MLDILNPIMKNIILLLTFPLWLVSSWAFASPYLLCWDKNEMTTNWANAISDQSVYTKDPYNLAEPAEGLDGIYTKLTGTWWILPGGDREQEQPILLMNYGFFSKNEAAQFCQAIKEVCVQTDSSGNNGSVAAAEGASGSKHNPIFVVFPKKDGSDTVEMENCDNLNFPSRNPKHGDLH